MRHNPFTPLSAVVESIINGEVSRSGEDITEAERAERRVVIGDHLRGVAVEHDYDPEALHGGQVTELLDSWHEHINAELIADEGEVEVVEGTIVGSEADEAAEREARYAARVDRLVADQADEATTDVDHNWFIANALADGPLSDSAADFVREKDAVIVTANPYDTICVITIDANGEAYFAGSNRLGADPAISETVGRVLAELAAAHGAGAAQSEIDGVLEGLERLAEELLRGGPQS